jgi:hypothetical protein
VKDLFLAVRGKLKNLYQSVDYDIETAALISFEKNRFPLGEIPPDGDLTNLFQLGGRKAAECGCIRNYFNCFFHKQPVLGHTTGF